MEEIILSDVENHVLSTLHKKIKEVKKVHGKVVTKEVFRLILLKCSFINYPLFFLDIDPEELVKACKTLKEKSMVKEFEYEKLPVLIPISEIYVTETFTSTREFTQKDIMESY
ncbi:MAG: hypothetical protein WAV23_00785 [Minisyncoccia bacterium]